MSTQNVWTEDLLWQARRGLELGHALCTCKGYYHTLWGTLRIAGVNNTMKGEEPLLASLMSPFLRDGARVMVGGSADPGVLCAIGRIYAPRMPALTVIDKCKAPLALIGEFAEVRGLECRTLNLDLLELDGHEQWDQIVLHYTADFMDSQIRQRLFRSLAASLAPQGILICTAMTGARIPADRRPEMEAAFFAHVVKALKDTPMAAQAQGPEFERQLRGYAAGRTARRLSLRTTQDTCEVLQSAGLQILSEHATSRARRLLVGLDVVDTSSIIIAGRR